MGITSLGDIGMSWSLSLTVVPVKWTQTFMLAIPFQETQKHFRNLSWILYIHLCVFVFPGPPIR